MCHNKESYNSISHTDDWHSGIGNLFYRLSMVIFVNVCTLLAFINDMLD